MQVVQPNATRLKPSLSRSVCNPDFARYSPTTCEPGASEVLTQGLTVRPFAAALRARRPAPIITLGLDVLVHDVIAAITTSPWPRSWLRPGTGTRLPISAPLPNSRPIASPKPPFPSLTPPLSCGPLCPARNP